MKDLVERVRNDAGTVVSIKYGKSKPEFIPFRDLVSRQFKYDPETGEIVRLETGPSNRHALGVCTTKDSGRYLSVRVAGITVKLHRLAFVLMTGDWPKNFVDHINGDKTDNRWSNLRDATRSENSTNCLVRNTNLSGLRGVTFISGKYNRKKPWQATIRVNGEAKSLGYFATKEEASAARTEAALKYHGKFSGQMVRGEPRIAMRAALSELQAKEAGE